jgi:adenylylsulfate kinase
MEKSKVNYKRHIAKTITWRIVGTLDTIVLAWIITGNPITGIKIGGVEIISKMVLYYAHERVWYRSKFGINK